MDCKRENPITNSAMQADRFAEAARALGTDEDEAVFRAKLAAIARHKPEDAPKPPKKPRAKD